jgi:tRNA pseudouridine55 synthase
VLDKPAGLTSHDCVARLRRLSGVKKVGHAGTLDPLATGVLILGVGRATRFLTYLVGLDKQYAATIRLGQSTTTDDAAGQPQAGAPASDLPPQRVEAAMAGLRGAISQAPSAVSAIKVDGRRAYARVRDGQAVELAARPVVVSRFEVLGRRPVGDWLDLDVIVHCSSGTYVRALARDLGAALGVGGHLTALRRLAVGPFEVASARTLEQLAAGLDLVPLAAAAARLFPLVPLAPEAARRLACGQVVAAPAAAGGQEGALVAASGPDGALVAMARWAAGGLAPEAVFA